jgi:hypothetical protein
MADGPSPAEAELIGGDVSSELSSNRTSLSFERTRMSSDRTLMSTVRTSLSADQLRVQPSTSVLESDGHPSRANIHRRETWACRCS